MLPMGPQILIKPGSGNVNLQGAPEKDSVLKGIIHEEVGQNQQAQGLEQLWNIVNTLVIVRSHKTQDNF
jgi:hypothetical protein